MDTVVIFVSPENLCEYINFNGSNRSIIIIKVIVDYSLLKGGTVMI